MLNQDLIRKQIHIIAQPGPLTSIAIQTIVEEAHRYGRECVGTGQHHNETKDTLTELLGEIRSTRQRWANLRPCGYGPGDCSSNNCDGCGENPRREEA